MTLTIREAVTPEDYAAFGRLCRDYVGWARIRYQDVPWLVEEVFGYQSFDDELKVLHIKYGPPKGRTWLVESDGTIVAGGAYHRLSDGVCELKRLYVSDAARGGGVGRKLTQALIEAAQADGFTLMRLDTGNLLHEAIAMYRSMGFAECPPYLTYPDRFMPYLVFMEKGL